MQAGNRQRVGEHPTPSSPIDPRETCDFVNPIPRGWLCACARRSCFSLMQLCDSLAWHFCGRPHAERRFCTPTPLAPLPASHRPNTLHLTWASTRRCRSWCAGTLCLCSLFGGQVGGETARGEARRQTLHPGGGWHDVRGSAQGTGDYLQDGGRDA